MPHAHPDRLLPNEILVPGESLVSPDGRFRFEFLADGHLQLQLFKDDYGPITLFRVGRGNRFTMDAQCDTIQTGAGETRNVGRPRLIDEANRTVWETNPIEFRRAVNHAFRMQSDGNIVFYGEAGEHVFAQWGGVRGALPDQLYGRPAAVIPNATTVTISTPGVVLLEGVGQGQGEVQNTGGDPVGIRTDSQYMKIEPGQSVSVVAPGVVDLASAAYSFRGGNGVDVRPNGDAIGKHPLPNGRWVQPVNSFGLFLNLPEGVFEGGVTSITIAKARLEGFPLPLDSKRTKG